MFHHVELYRLRPGVTLDLVRRARERLGALVESLPGVIHYAVAHNVAEEHGGYTLALFSAFESAQAYEIYTRNPEVQRIVATELGPVVEARIVAQGVDSAGVDETAR